MTYTYEGTSEVANAVCSAIDSVYPGFLDTENLGQIDLIQLRGSIECLFVQSRAQSALNNAVLQTFIDKENTFQNYMTFTKPMVLKTLGSKTYVSTSQDNVRIVPENYGQFKSLKSVDYTSLMVQTSMLNQQPPPGTAWLKPIEKDRDLIASNISTQYSDALESRSFYNGSSTYTSTWADVHASQLNALNSLCARLKGAPSLCYIGHSPSFRYDNVFDNLMTEDLADPKCWVNKMFTTANEPNPFHWAPSVPGYSRVFMITTSKGQSGPSQSRSTFICTYIPGQADLDHFYFELVSYDNPNDQYGYHPFIYQGKIANGFGIAAPDVTKPNFASFAAQYSPFVYTITELDAAVRKDVLKMELGQTGGAMLFGPPNATFNATGVSETATVSVTRKSGDAQNVIVLSLIDLNSDNYQWTVSKDWYVSYMNTGYGVFTPRSSNIRANVLKQWEVLDYPYLTIRGTNQPYITTWTVDKLPEAVQYAKARAKACKDNDFRKQVAIAGTDVTWDTVHQKEQNARSRLTWMNTGNAVVANDAIDLFTFADDVIYKKDASGIITRTDVNETRVITLQNEDDQAQIVYDRMYNTKAKVVGVTWDELYTLDASEQSELEDAKITNATKPSLVEKREIIGFARWIDPSGQADVMNLSEEQRFRLHIRNSIEFDKMNAPLVKVLASFGFDTLIKYAKALK